MYRKPHSLAQPTAPERGRQALSRRSVGRVRSVRACCPFGLGLADKAIPPRAEQDVCDLVGEPFAAPVDAHAIASRHVCLGGRQAISNEGLGAAGQLPSATGSLHEAQDNVPQTLSP